MVTHIRAFQIAIADPRASNAEVEALKYLEEFQIEANRIAWDGLYGEKVEEIKQHSFHNYEFLEDWLDALTYREHEALRQQWTVAIRGLNIAPLQPDSALFENPKEFAARNQATSQGNLLDRLRELEGEQKHGNY